MKSVTLAWQDTHKQLVLADSLLTPIRIQSILRDIHIMETQPYV